MDIICRKCGEPWDAYGARHGDMTPGEYRAFIRGDGCPCCPDEADPDGRDWTMEFLQSLEEATDGPEAEYAAWRLLGA